MWHYVLIAATVTYLVGKLVERQDGPDVRRRFLEANTDYVTEGMQQWVLVHRNAAAAYVFPVLIPFGFLVAILWGSFLATGTLAIAAKIGLRASIAWPLALLPAFYIVTSVIEKTMLIFLVKVPSSINDETVNILASS